MRKIMTKEVTQTTVKIAKMTQGENGLPVAEKMDDVILIGNVTLEKAQKEVGKMYPGQSVTVFGVEPETKNYEMEVAEFIKYATVKVDAEPETTEGKTQDQAAAQ